MSDFRPSDIRRKAKLFMDAFRNPLEHQAENGRAICVQPRQIQKQADGGERLDLVCDTKVHPLPFRRVMPCGLTAYTKTVPNRTHIGGELITDKAKIAISLPYVSILARSA